MDLEAILEPAVEAGWLREAGARDVRLADLILRGRRTGEEHESYLVVEVSAVIGRENIQRALRRAALLGKALGEAQPVLAAVAGERLTNGACKLAEAQGVVYVLDGRS